MTYVELTGSGWGPVFASAAPLVSTGPGRLSLGFVSSPGTARPLSAAVDRERVYQYARRALCMDVCFLGRSGQQG